MLSCESKFEVTDWLCAGDNSNYETTGNVAIVLAVHEFIKDSETCPLEFNMTLGFNKLGVIGIVVSALAYCTGDTDSIPSCSKDSKSQPYQCPTSSLDSYSQWRENGDSVTEGFWPRDHDVSLTHLR